MKKTDIIVGICAFVFVATGLTVGYCSGNPNRSNWKKAIAQVKYRTWGNTGTRMFAFEVDGKLYEDVRGGKGVTGECPGDRYEILYNPNKPTEILVLEERPVFLVDEPLASTVGTVVKKPKLIKRNTTTELWLRVKYTVDDNEFTRVQKIVSNASLDSLFVEKGTRYNVRYWPPNPQRAIIDYNAGPLEPTR